MILLLIFAVAIMTGIPARFADDPGHVMMFIAVTFAAKELMRLMVSSHPELNPANGPNAVFANSTGPPDSLK